jgi:hypothetical protein
MKQDSADVAYLDEEAPQHRVLSKLDGIAETSYYPRGELQD